MTDTILKRAEKYIKGKGQSLNKYDLVGFANAETALLSKHILELQQTNGALTDRINELEKRFEPQAFTEVMKEIEENYNNKVRLTKATEIIKSLRMCLLDFDEDTIEPYKQCIDEAEAFINEVEK